MTQDSDSTSRRPIGQYIGTILIVVAIAVGTAELLVRYLSNEMLLRDARVTQQLVQSVANSRNASTYFIATRDQTSDLESFLDEIMRIPDVLRANAFATDGTVLWSSEEQLTGHRYTDNDELMRAVRGELVVESGLLDASVKSEHILFDWHVGQWFVESYIPIRYKGRVDGVVELYKLPRSLSTTIANTRMIIWSGALLGAVLIIGLAIRLAYRVSRFDMSLTEESDQKTSADTFLTPFNSVTTPSKQQQGYADRASPNWFGATAITVSAVLIPMLIAAGVLFRYGVDDDSELGKMTQNDSTFIGFLASAITLAIYDSASVSTESESPAVTTAPAKDLAGTEQLDTELIVVADNSVIESIDNELPSDITTTAEQVSLTQTEDLHSSVIDNSPARERLSAVDSVGSPAESDAAKDKTSSSGSSFVEKTVFLNESQQSRQTEVEMLFWDSIKAGTDAELFDAYISQYPNGAFVAIADHRRREISEQKADELKNYIDLSWRAFERRALTTPTDDNALKWAQKSLSIEPENSSANIIIEAIIDTYIEWAVDTHDRQKPKLSERYLRRAQSLYQHATTEQLAIISSVEHVLQLGQTPTITSTPNPQLLNNQKQPAFTQLPKHNIEQDAFAQRLVALRERLSAYQQFNADWKNSTQQ